MASKLEIKWDHDALLRAMGNSEEINEAIKQETETRISKANSLGGSFKTGYFYDREEKKRKGGTTAKYKGDVKRLGQHRLPVGIVTTDNYAANQDNLKHNTLLKVL